MCYVSKFTFSKGFVHRGAKCRNLTQILQLKTHFAANIRRPPMDTLLHLVFGLVFMQKTSLIVKYPFSLRHVQCLPP